MNEREFWEYAQIEEINEQVLRDDILITVWCPTYNHENYIKETLDGFIAQETDFVFQVLIFDDASNDKTAEIVREYAKKYPDLFHVFLAGRNTFWHPDREKFTTSLLKRNLFGKYTAICEGDDCWIDPYKLQIQFDYLESHPACSLYMHNSLKINYLDGFKISTQNSYPCVDERDLSCEEVVMQYRCNPATSSMLFKKELFFIPGRLAGLQTIDYMIQLNCMVNGDVHYSNRIMSIYRFCTEGSYTKNFSKDKYFWYRFQMLQIIFLYQFDRYTLLKYHKWLAHRIQGRVFTLIDGFENCLEEHIEEFRQQGKSVSFENEDILKRLIVLDKQVKDGKFIRNELTEFMNQFQNIVIMGTGNYADKLSNQLEINHIDFCGYGVSKLDKCREFRGKRVWQLDQIHKELSDVGVIVAIKPLNWNELTAALENAGINNYYCPFKL